MAALHCKFTGREARERRGNQQSLRVLLVCFVLTKQKYDCFTLGALTICCQCSRYGLNSEEGIPQSLYIRPTCPFDNFIQTSSIFLVTVSQDKHYVSLERKAAAFAVNSDEQISKSHGDLVLASATHINVL